MVNLSPQSGAWLIPVKVGWGLGILFSKTKEFSFALKTRVSFTGLAEKGLAPRQGSALEVVSETLRGQLRAQMKCPGLDTCATLCPRSEMPVTGSVCLTASLPVTLKRYCISRKCKTASNPVNLLFISNSKLS